MPNDENKIENQKQIAPVQGAYSLVIKERIQKYLRSPEVSKKKRGI